MGVDFAPLGTFISSHSALPPPTLYRGYMGVDFAPLGSIYQLSFSLATPQYMIPYFLAFLP